MGTKNKDKKYDPYFSTEKIISERKPSKSNPAAAGFDPAAVHRIISL